ncbi:hypothetical protein MSPP1_002043 [Malassezia sp. CBS 17886]|nr:hypothetical protein MSPP1_002043 [Malassezia sp. CBS 17886]
MSAAGAEGLPQPCVILETELLLTFSAKEAADGSASRASGGGALASVMLLPQAATDTAGRFRVWLVAKNNATAQRSSVHLVWDRKSRGGFPELPELKRLIRDIIAPELSLGHSEKHGA